MGTADLWGLLVFALAAVATAGGIEFVDCTVEDPRGMPFLKGAAPKDLADPWKDIRGNIRVTGPGAAVDLGGAKIALRVEAALAAK